MALAKIPKLTLTFAKASKMSKEGGSWEASCISSLMKCWNVNTSCLRPSFLSSVSLLISFLKIKQDKYNHTVNFQWIIFRCSMVAVKADISYPRFHSDRDQCIFLFFDNCKSLSYIINQILPNVIYKIRSNT